MKKLFENKDLDTAEDVIDILDKMPDNMTIGMLRRTVKKLREWEQEAVEEELAEDERRWVPEEGERYWWIDFDGGLNRYVNDNNFVDPQVFKIGNHYRNKEEAQQKVKELKAIESIRRYCSETWGYDPQGWADWGDESAYDYESKILIYWERNSAFEYKDSEFDTKLIRFNKILSPIGYFKEKSHAEDIIEHKREELKTIFNVE